ncbi:MAG: PorP/SprF family type IX secretion system membrane protein [Crocinitomicaceae bacterium]
MKHLVTIAFISTCLFSFGQSESYWNNYANFNPAMSGFQYDQHATATYYNYYPSLSGSYDGIFADAGINLAKNHGIGVVYSGDFDDFAASHKALVNYNYQLHFKKAGKLSLGTGIGYGVYTVHNALSSILTSGEKVGSFELNLGASYNWRNVFVGFSATNLMPMDDLEYPFISFNSRYRGYNFHAQHTARIAEKFQLITRVLYTYENGFQRLQPNLTVAFMGKYSLGASYQARDGFGINAGWDILNKFRVAYNYSATVSALNNGVSGGKHELSIGYVLKKKPVLVTKIVRE